MPDISKIKIKTSDSDQGTIYNIKDSKAYDEIANKPGEITTGKQYTIDGQTVTAGTYAEAFNDLETNKAAGQYSHAEGTSTSATGPVSHAEGVSTTASGQFSHSEGYATSASGNRSHAEGNYTAASGENSHAEGSTTTASGSCSHAEGFYTTASGSYSHVEGNRTIASGAGSHAEGDHTKASSTNQHVQGKYNVEDVNNTYAFIIGNGTADNTRHNAFAVDWNGLIYVNGASTGVDVNALAPQSTTYTKTEVDTALSAKLNTADITTTISNSSTDSQVPSAKAVYGALSNSSSLDQTKINVIDDEIAVHKFDTLSDAKTYINSNTKPKSVVIGSNAGVTSIGGTAFYECASLTSIYIPSGITSIGAGAFASCTSLTSITIPSGVTSIGSGTFMDCTSLTSITIPSSVTSIANDAFNGCKSLTSVNIPSGVTSIDESTFYNCSSLTSITIPSGVTSIANNAFGKCSSLKSITIPSTVTSISSGAFSGCDILLLDNYKSRTGYPWGANKIYIQNEDVTTTLDSNSTDRQVPTAKTVYDEVESITSTTYTKAETDAKMAQKATTSDVERETQNLQNQINEIVRAPQSGGDVAAEVAQARVGADSLDYPTLKSRLDTESNEFKDNFENLVINGTTNIAPYTAIQPAWMQGVIDGTTGVNIDSDKRIRSGYITGIVRVTPASGSKFYPVFYRDYAFVSSGTWQTASAKYELETLGANQVRLVLASVDNSNITPNYASNIVVETKGVDIRSAMFRGTLEDLGYTTLQSCKKEGYYTYASQTAENLQDVPDEFKHTSGIVEVWSHITAGGAATLFQRLCNASGLIAFRWLRSEVSHAGQWVMDDSYRFRGTFESLGIDDMDDCKLDGYFTIQAVTTSSIDNYPEKFINSAGAVQVFANITTADQKTWIQTVTNSGGEIAIRYIREFGTKGDWVYVTSKPTFSWFALGDSITQGYYSSGPNQFAITSENWVKFAAQRIGAIVTNYGIGGSGYMDNVHATDHKNAKEKVADIDFAGADLVTLAYGVNDWKYGYPLGSMADDITSGTSVIANMRYVIEKIISDNPNCKIIVITPLNCRGYDFDYGSEATNYGIGYVIPENGKTLQDFFDGIKEVCEYYGIELIDQTHTSVVNRKSIINLLKDGVHPSLEGHIAIGHELGRKINFN